MLLLWHLFDLFNYRFLALIMSNVWVSTCEKGLRFNHKVVDYSHDIQCYYYTSVLAMPGGPLLELPEFTAE